jgi:tetratricopeptide (TPR) repeat protein
MGSLCENETLNPGAKMSDTSSWRLTLATALLAGCSLSWAAAQADPAAETRGNSSLDAPLFYQLLIGEIELNSGEAGSAFEVILDAARRTRDDTLFRRAVDIALQGRAGDQALSASRAWRTSNPNSLDALRVQLQILSALSRMGEAAEPLRAMLALTPEAEQPSLIAATPRFLQRASDPKQAAAMLEDVLRPYLDKPATAAAARVAMARGWLAAGETAKALALAQVAAKEDPAAPGPALLAMELIASQPAAEKIVAGFLQRADADFSIRLSYVRALTGLQRYADAVQQLEIVTRQKPDLAPPYLSLGALQLELRHPKQGDAALLKYIELAQAQKAGAAPVAEAPGGDEDDEAAKPEAGLVQAWLLLAQSAEQRGDFKAAEGWLAKVEDPQRALEVQTRRASILARQGRIKEARELIQRTPEKQPEDVRAKLLAEAGMLREVKHWKESFEVLGSASQRFPDDADLLYEQAMMAEKLDRMDEMERLLRKVIEIKPDNAHAHNALGYSLADRRTRLPEARLLIQKALELSPGDPFITDSLGWVEYRMGNRDEALRLLRQAYKARPDPEIAAHLGEVLWAYGQQDEAKRVWTEAKGRDAGNDVLRETLSRLKVGL